MYYKSFFFFEITSSNAKSKIIQHLTVDICDTFKKRNPCFEYDTACNPKRVLTKPSAPAKNDGFDNENSDFILYVHGLIGPEENKKR
jgi:dual specificity protein kinase YAK1